MVITQPKAPDPGFIGGTQDPELDGYPFNMNPAWVKLKTLGIADVNNVLIGKFPEQGGGFSIPGGGTWTNGQFIFVDRVNWTGIPRDRDLNQIKTMTLYKLPEKAEGLSEQQQFDILHWEQKYRNIGHFVGHAKSFYQPIVEPPSDETPDNILDLVKGVLRDILFEGVTVQDALVNWKVLPVWVGNLFNNVIELLTVNVAPEGEPPLRMLFPGGAFITKQIPKIGISIADDVVKKLIAEGSSKLSAKIVSNPAGMNKVFAKLSVDQIKKLVAGLGVGIDEYNVMSWTLRMSLEEATERALPSVIKATLASPEGTIKLATASINLAEKQAAKVSNEIFKQGGKPLTQKFMRTIAEQEAAIIGKGWSKTILGKYVQQELLRQVARDITSSKPLWKQLITLTGPVAKWVIIAAGLMGIANWATWPVADNMATLLSMQTRDLSRRVKNGEITKEAAMKQINSLKTLFDEGKRFVDINAIINPVTRFLAPTFKLTTDLSDIVINQEIKEIQESDVTPPGIADELISVKSVPSGAKIFIDNEFTFEITDTLIKLKPGNYILTLKKTGFIDHTQALKVIEGVSGLTTATLIPVDQPPITPPAPPITVPEDEVLIELEPTKVTFNAWKVTIKAVDSETNAEINAAILINDQYMGKYTPWFFYLFPESEYNIKLRKKGYRQGETTFTTKPLPT